MQINKYGNDVGYAKRLEDIKARYGEDADIYKKFKRRSRIMELKEIEQEIQKIKQRNKRVELDKKWETS